MQYSNVRSIIVLVSALSLFVAGGVVHAATHDASVPAANAIRNGTFAASSKTGQIDAWTLLPGTTSVPIDTASGAPYASVANTDGAGARGISQDVALNPEWSKVLVRGYVKVESITAAAASSKTTESSGVLMALTWKGSKGQSFPSITADVWSAATARDAEINHLMTVPPGADHLTVALEVSGIVGTADFRDLSLVGFVQTLDDEFDGNALDSSRWTASEGIHDVMTPEAQWFDPGHVSVANGIARIHAEQKPHGDLAYESGEITSIGKFQQRYGLFEFRLKVPETPGIWPAAYLLKWDDGWPPEIDVEEYSGNWNHDVLETNHYADDYGRHSQSQVNWDGSQVDRREWHTYAVVWEPGALAWYFDDAYKGTSNAPLTSDVPMYIRINMALGSFGGNPAAGTWPQDFDCDFVRAYQRHDLALPVYPINSEEITLPVNTARLKAITCSPMAGATAEWTLVDGPGKAIIADPHVPDTTATLDAPGMYRFKLTVSKGASTGSEQMLVYVDPPVGRHK